MGYNNINMKKAFLFTLMIILCLAFTSGCSHVLYKRDPNKNDPGDLGSETMLKLRGPKAVLQHIF